MKKYHFIAGLPRSGSTLLAAILNQNPNFFAGISNPLGEFVKHIINSANLDPGWRSYTSDERMKLVISGLFDNFYYDVEKPVCFSTNRNWATQFHILNAIYPNAKIICVVRDIVEILNSFEWLYQKNPFKISAVYGPTLKENEDEPSFVSKNVYQRSYGTLTYIDRHLSALKEIYFGPYNHKMMLIEYKHLCENPTNVIKNLYEFIEEPLYSHDFNKLEYENISYDYHMNAPGMHTVRKNVQSDNKSLILPFDIIEKCTGMEFWRDYRFTQE